MFHYITLSLISCLLYHGATPTNELQIHFQDKQSQSHLKGTVLLTQNKYLPPELWLHVFSFLSHGIQQKEDAHDWVRTKLVCKDFRMLSEESLRHYLIISDEYVCFKKCMNLRATLTNLTPKSICRQELYWITLPRVSSLIGYDPMGIIIAIHAGRVKSLHQNSEYDSSIVLKRIFLPRFIQMYRESFS
jgi:hypothetical protein